MGECISRLHIIHSSWGERQNSSSFPMPYPLPIHFIPYPLPSILLPFPPGLLNPELPVADRGPRWDSGDDIVFILFLVFSSVVFVFWVFEFHSWVVVGMELEEEWRMAVKCMEIVDQKIDPWGEGIMGMLLVSGSIYQPSNYHVMF